MLQLLTIFLFGFPQADDLVALKEEFNQEAPKAWEKYATRAKRLQGKWTLTERKVGFAEAISEERGEFKQREGCSLFIGQFIREGGKPSLEGELTAVNPYYSFRLRRSAPEGAWSIGRVGHGPLTPSSREDPSRAVESILKTPYTFSSIVSTLAVSLADPGFSIDKVTFFDYEGDRLHKVEFRYSPLEDAARRPLRRGWVLLDPKRYWVMRAFEATAKWGENDTNYVASFQYHDTRGGFPILKQVSVRRKIPSKNREFETTQTYELEERDVAETEFRLSAFGFREPPGVPIPAGTRWYLWFMGIAAVSLVLGWFLWRNLQQRKLAAAKPKVGNAI